jgi:hypothetical protein
MFSGTLLPKISTASKHPTNDRAMTSTLVGSLDEHFMQVERIIVAVIMRRIDDLLVPVKKSWTAFCL